LFALAFFLFLLVGSFLILLTKYLRLRRHVLNVFRLGTAHGVALVAVARAAYLPRTRSRIPFRKLNFPIGNFLRRNEIGRFLPVNCVVFRACRGVREFRSSGVPQIRHLLLSAVGARGSSPAGPQGNGQYSTKVLRKGTMEVLKPLEGRVAGNALSAGGEARATMWDGRPRPSDCRKRLGNGQTPERLGEAL